MATEVAERKLKEKEHLDKREYWWWAEKARSPRLDYLRKAVWFKGAKGSAYLPGIKLDTIGVDIYTEVYQRTEAAIEPPILTRAKAFAEVLDKIPIFITDHARLVGYCGAAPNTLFWAPVFAYAINEDLLNDRSGLIDDEDRPRVKECLDWWKPRTFQTMAERILTRKEKMDSALSIYVWGNAHLNGFETANMQDDWLFKGYGHIIGEIDKKIEVATKRLQEGPLNAPVDLPLIEKIDNWTAMKLAMEASVRWIRRYARLAKVVAENFESDPRRREELMEIHETCDKIATEPPEHFWESLQHEHFYQILKRYECPETAWPCRPDYTHWPYYRKDVIEEKNLTREDAIDYVGEFEIRCFETSRPWSRIYREVLVGSSGPLVWTIGGVDPETGEDACNDLTNAFLEAARLIRCADPTFGFRWHARARKETLREVFECIRHGLGYPSIRNDEVCIANMQHHFGYNLKQARGWIHAACMSPSGVTKETTQPVRYAASMVTGDKALEFALWNGWDPVTKMQVGPKTGDAAQFKTFDEFYDVWLKQSQFCFWSGIRVHQKCRWIKMKHFPRPWMSASYERCVETGQNCDESKEKGNPWQTALVFFDQMDALTAIKKLIFEEKKYTMAQLLEMLAANWEGYEAERMDFVRAPKWGNDIDEVDQFIAKAHKDLHEQVTAKTIEWCGEYWTYLPQNAAGFVVASTKVGALPNGRRLGDPLYDGGCSPGAGFDKKGPTAVLLSVAKLDHVHSVKSTLLNQRLSPTNLAGEKGYELWLNYMKTWQQLGINHVQFNMIDNETLYAAQKEPEKYSEVLVRVAGYSAHFVDLNKRAQDAIIARSVQRL